MEYSVRVERVRLRFSSAHMATFGGEMEPLHGHNYSVAIEVRGGLTDDAWVIDFGVLKRIGREICDELDHKFLLQRESALLEIDEGMSNWKVRLGERGFVFSKGDVLALPIDNTTAERLAEYILGRIRSALLGQGYVNVASIAVTVEEAPGQSATASEMM
jgi:6-pyruvoyltetrahydropterin/6-carboxytetrahydropterin synthase